ncbi:MAG TPA: hypothetical protein VMM13_00515 [Euzebya sp.]|nr:hypothetical protein [Euzebya sp.]
MGEGGRPVAAGLGEVLVRLAADKPGLLVVAGIDPGPATWFAEVWPERVLTVPPPHARLAVAEGIIAGGQDVVVMWDGDATTLPLAPEVAVLVVSAAPAHLRLAHRAAITVVQPGWPEDLPVALLGALDLDVGVLLHLPDHGDVAARGPLPLALPLGGPRVLRRGRDGLVIGAGATAAVAAAVGDGLAVRRRHVTALDAAMITPGSGLDAALLHDHLLVGALDSPRAEALVAVAVDGAPERIVDLVATTLWADEQR